MFVPLGKGIKHLNDAFVESNFMDGLHEGIISYFRGFGHQLYRILLRSQGVIREQPKGWQIGYRFYAGGFTARNVICTACGGQNRRIFRPAEPMPRLTIIQV